jgi:hypothetical protein
MPNTIKYNTNAQTLALKKGNYWIGTGDVAKGPTSSTDYWNGITPPSSGYTIYQNKASNGPSVYVASNDSQLISFTNHIAGTSYTTVNESFNYFNGQSDKMVFNRDMESIVTDGLVLYMDAGFLPSYSRNGTTWNDLSGNDNNGTLTNGPTFSSANGGIIVFDGTNDYAVKTSPSNIPNNQSAKTISVWFYSSRDNNFQDTMLATNSGVFNSGVSLKVNNQRKMVVEDLNGNLILTSTVTPITNVRYNFTFTTTGTTNKIYVNGLQDATNTFTHPTGSVTGIYLGSNQNAGNPHLMGGIAIVLYYNRELSATEVLQNYNAQKARFGL